MNCDFLFFNFYCNIIFLLHYIIFYFELFFIILNYFVMVKLNLFIKQSCANCRNHMFRWPWSVSYYGFILCSLMLTELAGFINYALINDCRVSEEFFFQGLG